jgi:hypothetical protein
MLTVQRALHRAIPLHNQNSRGCCAALALLSALGLCLCVVATHRKVPWHAYAWAGLGGLLVSGCTVLHCLRPTAPVQPTPQPPQPALVQQPQEPQLDEHGLPIMPGYDSAAWQRDIDLVHNSAAGMAEIRDAAARMNTERLRRQKAMHAYSLRVLAQDQQARFPYATRHVRPFSPKELELAGSSIEQLQALFGRPLELLSTQPLAGHTQVTTDELINRIDVALARSQAVLLNEPRGSGFMPVDMTCTALGVGRPNLALLVSHTMGTYYSRSLTAYQGTVVIGPPPVAAPAAPPAPMPEGSCR